MRTRDGDRVGVFPGGHQFVALLPADAHLLREVVLVFGLALVGHGYEA
jgi:hypothetical protein